MKLETKTKFLATTLALASSSAALASGHSSEDLEERVAALEGRQSAAGQAWSDRLELFGSLDVDAISINPESGNATSDLIVSKAELGANFLLSQQLTATGSLLFEEDATDLEIDTAKLTYQTAVSGVSFTLGQIYLPFGNTSTAMVSDPLTRQFGETRETALSVNYAQGPINAGAYVFNGDQDKNGDNALANYGSTIAYLGDGFRFGIDHISNIADADLLQGYNYGYSIGADMVSATSIHGQANIGPVGLSAERIAADGVLGFDGNNSEPKVTNVEASYQRDDHSFAVSYQSTEEALFLGLPEQRTSLAYRTTMFEGFDLGIELARDEDYSVSDGGSGTTTETVIFRMSVQYP